MDLQERFDLWYQKMEEEISAEGVREDAADQVSGAQMGYEAIHRDGREDATRHNLAEIYRARFGALPHEIYIAIQHNLDLSLLQGWVPEFATAREEEILSLTREIWV